jgi:hypothetical protein
LNEFLNSQAIGLENETTHYYVPLLGILFLLPIISIAFIEYLKTTNTNTQQKILWGGLASGLFLSIFSISFLITNLLIFLHIGTETAAFNVSVYALFSMPFMVGMLTYLIVKYEAFNIKAIKSILYILICMAILFVNIFLPY